MTTIDSLSSFDEATSPRLAKANAPDGFGLKSRVITGSVAAIMLLAGIGGWAATARLSGAVISAGTVLVEENLKVVQHVDGGVVRAHFRRLVQVVIEVVETFLLGDDAIYGDAGDDALSGGAGSDLLLGGDGDDTLSGGVGNDVLRGEAGDDEIAGGDGDDRIVGDAGDDTIDGGRGFDTLDYSEAQDDLLVDFVAGLAMGESIGADTFSSIETVLGGSGDDVFVIGATATVISGGRGDDLFIFTVTDTNPVLSSELVHQILDFVIGDRIHVADYSISRRAERTEEERFDDLYDNLDEAPEMGTFPIKVSYGRYDNIDTSIIEADADGDGNYDIAIRVDGLNIPFHFEHSIT